jgi:hypothetical protein
MKLTLSTGPETFKGENLKIQTGVYTHTGLGNTSSGQPKKNPKVLKKLRRSINIIALSSLIL